MKKVLLTKISATANESLGASLAHALVANLRTFATRLSGPHRLIDGWDINCMLDGSEFWIRLKRSRQHWVLVLESVWDFQCLARKRLRNSEVTRLYRCLVDWKNRHQKQSTDAGFEQCSEISKCSENQ